MGRERRVLVVNKNYKRYSLPYENSCRDVEFAYRVACVDNETRTHLKEKGIKYRETSAWALAKECMLSEYDAVVAGIDFFLVYRLAALAGRVRGKRVIMVSDRWNMSPRRMGLRYALFLWLSNRLMGLPTHYLVPGEKHKSYWLGRGVPENHIKVFSPGQAWRLADEAGGVNREETRQRFGVEGKTVFLYFGRVLWRRKNLRLLLDAFGKVKAKRPGTALLIGGYGGDRAALEAYAAEQGLKDVHFLPSRHDVESVADYYAACDVFVLPSRWEPFGMALLEAFACGKPLIASTDCGAGHELIAEGRNGYLVEADNETALAEALARAAEPGRLAGLREAAAAMAAERRMRVKSLEESVAEIVED